MTACTSTTVDRHTVQYTPQRIIQDELRHEAEIAQEARGPEIPPRDYKRLIAAMNLKRERAQLELAQYAKFQQDQKLALASASAPKLLVSASGIPADYRRLDYGGLRDHRQISYTTASSSVMSSRDYPSRFYRRQVQEDSAVQAQSEFNEAARAVQSSEPSDADAPYAIPVPGRPGFVTMPPKMGGYIDVRGYAPGAYVMDPWTKTIIRVP